MIRDLAKVFGLIGVLAISSCSLLVDWSGYTGGKGPSTSDAAASINDDATASDATMLDVTMLDVTVGPPDAKDVRDSSDVASRIPDAPTGGDAMEAGRTDSGNMAPPCSRLNCGGCCTTVLGASFCAGGEAPDTCGEDGAKCQNCTAQGLTCDSTKSCVQPPPPAEGGAEAGTQPVCSVSFCASLHICMPVWQDACCRSDNFCGCQIKTPPGITVPGTCI